MTTWFRRPDGILVAAEQAERAAVYEARGYEPVETAKAEAEVQSGKQAELAGQLGQAAKASDERHRVAEAARRRRERVARAQAAADEAGLAVEPPQPPRPDLTENVAADEAGPETREH